MKHLFTLICSTICSTLLLTFSAHAADLKLEIADVKSNEGHLLIALYDSAESFLKKPAKALRVAAQANTNSVQFTDLPVGDYAVVVFHDANNNGKLDRNPVGMPIEDYAFGNNAVGNMAAPTFLESKISVPEAGASARLNLH